jgi:hypothetical protein
MQVSYTEDKIVFIDAKGRSESLDMFEAMSDADAVRSIATEQKAAGSASKGAISLLAKMLDNPRLDSYRGTTAANEAVPNELKAAIREIETEYLKPIFCLYHTDKGAKPATVEKLWQAYSADLKAGGSYAVAKSEATKYFSYVGKTPICDNGKLLSVAAIKKLILNAKDGMEKKEKPGIADKLVALALELHDRTETTIIGDPSSAIASLRAMLVTFEKLQREDMEAAQVAHTLKNPVGDVATKAAAIIGTVQKAPKPTIAEQAAVIGAKAYAKHARHANMAHNQVAPV